MDEQLGRPPREEEGLDTEYEHVAQVRAFEAFQNIVRREGISLPEKGGDVSFTSPRRLNMKAFKERGLIWSYSIIRVRKVKDVIEEG